jgi:hypothetical protein
MQHEAHMLYGDRTKRYLVICSEQLVLQQHNKDTTVSMAVNVTSLASSLHATKYNERSVPGLLVNFEENFNFQINVAHVT